MVSSSDMAASSRLPHNVLEHAVTVVEPTAAACSNARQAGAAERRPAAHLAHYDRQMTTAPRYVVIGGGIVGLAVADLLTSARPGSEVTVVEKEPGWATHQTGRNSGVIHSGLYYAPGSKKARMCQAGARSMVRFAEEEGVAHEICGKLVVATSESPAAGSAPPARARPGERAHGLLALGRAGTRARAARRRRGRAARPEHRHHRLRQPSARPWYVACGLAAPPWRSGPTVVGATRVRRPLGGAHDHRRPPGGRGRQLRRPAQ